MLNITLAKFGLRDDYYYFEVYTEDKACYTSETIAKLFNLDINLYNQILINEVIKHEKYFINEQHKDFSFRCTDISEETYIDRFKETFADQLILLTLE